jgi:hypothetical protein
VVELSMNVEPSESVATRHVHVPKSPYPRRPTHWNRLSLSGWGGAAVVERRIRYIGMRVK